MKVLITGAMGQLGTELRRCLRLGRTELGEIPPAFQGAEVLALGRDGLDISDPEQIRTVVRREAPAVIINCGALSDVDACETRREEAFSVNAGGPRDLAVTAREVGAKLLHISTDYVFSGDAETPYEEWSLCAPRTAYGQSKLLGELYVRDLADRFFIIRSAWLFGYSGDNFVRRILKRGRETGALRVVCDQVGSPTHASDLVHHLLKLAVTEAYGLYHCAGVGSCSRYEFALEIVRLAGLDCTVDPCETKDYPLPAMRPAYSCLDNQMLRCTVGNEMRPWMEATASFMQHGGADVGEPLP